MQQVGSYLGYTGRGVNACGPIFISHHSAASIIPRRAGDVALWLAAL